MAAEDAELSQSTKFFLYAAGATAIVLAITSALVAWKLLKAVLALFSRPAAKPKQQKQKAEARPDRAAERADRADRADRGPDLKSLIKESQKASKQKNVTKDESIASHALFINTLKGHGDVVHSVAWSPDGRCLASACEDMYIRVYDVAADPTAREPKHRRIKTPRIPIGAGFVDRAGVDVVSTVMRGIPDTMAAAFGPVKNGEATQYEALWEAKQVHTRNELALVARCVPATPGRGAVIVSCSQKKDVRVMDANQGRELATLEPNSMVNHDMAVSQDGRFVAVASFLNEVKVWELKFARDTGTWSGAIKAMELKGHKGQVMSVAFSPDNTRVVTASKDLTLRVWNIDVRYHLSEDPKTVWVVPMPLAGGKVYQHLAYGPSGVIACSYEGMVHLLSAASGELLETVDAHEGQVTCMAWCPRLVKLPGQAQPAAVLATCGRDKRVRLWRAPL